MGPNITSIFCTAKDTIDKMKRKTTEWDKIFTNDMTDKVFLKIFDWGIVVLQCCVCFCFTIK